MSKLTMVKGLPASGKSTRAKEQVANDKEGKTLRINKDDIRTMLHDGQRSKSNERQVLLTRDTLIRQGLEDGMHVIVDDTNFAPIHESNLRDIAEGYGAEFDIRFFDVSVFECIRRDSRRAKPVGYEVIMQMYERHVMPKPGALGEEKYGKASAYIFDIDGTLATMNGRHPYDWDKVGEDEPNVEVRRVLSALKLSGYSIILMSGRSEEAREATEEWLARHGVQYDALHLRKDGDTRKDAIVKSEMLDEELALGRHILGVFDDRQQTTEMFRDRGLRVFNVAYGCF